MNTDYFYKNKSNSIDGLHPYCKGCSKKKARKWTLENYDTHLDSLRKQNQKPKIKQQLRESNKKRRLSGRLKEWQVNNKDRVNGYNAQRRLHKKHEITKEEWEACREYFDYSCAYCGINENDAKEQQGNYLHKEHVEHDGANDLSNCVPACKSCNSRKHAAKLEDWYNVENDRYDTNKLNKIYQWLNQDYKKYIS